MNASPASGQRSRTCRACGKKFDYPVKGSDATRHHCAECALLPEDTRKVVERLNTRIASLERLVNRLSPPPA